MDSFIINQTNSVKGVPSKFQVKLPTPIFLKDKSSALAYLGIYYSWRNITKKLGNNFFQYQLNGSTYDVKIPDGFYNVSDLNTFFELVMEDNGHYLVDADGNYVYFMSLNINLVYYEITFTCKPIPTVLPLKHTNPKGLDLSGKTPQFIFSNAGFNQLLGINSGTYPPSALETEMKTFNSQNIPQIAPVTTVLVGSNLSNNQHNNVNRTIFFQFTPNTTYGSYMTYQPSFPIFFDSNNGYYDGIELNFYDQNGNSLDILDTNITATILLKDK